MYVYACFVFFLTTLSQDHNTRHRQSHTHTYGKFTHTLHTVHVWVFKVHVPLASCVIFLTRGVDLLPHVLVFNLVVPHKELNEGNLCHESSPEKRSPLARAASLPWKRLSWRLISALSCDGAENSRPTSSQRAVNLQVDYFRCATPHLHRNCESSLSQGHCNQQQQQRKKGLMSDDKDQRKSTE